MPTKGMIPLLCRSRSIALAPTYYSMFECGILTIPLGHIITSVEVMRAKEDAGTPDRRRPATGLWVSAVTSYLTTGWSQGQHTLGIFADWQQ